MSAMAGAASRHRRRAAIALLGAASLAYVVYMMAGEGRSRAPSEDLPPALPVPPPRSPAAAAGGRFVTGAEAGAAAARGAAAGGGGAPGYAPKRVLVTGAAGFVGFHAGAPPRPHGADCWSQRLCSQAAPRARGRGARR